MFSEFPGFEVTIDQFSLYDLVIGPNRVRVGWTSITSGILGFPNEISRQLFSLYTPDPSSDVIAPQFGPIAKSYRLNWSIVTSNPVSKCFREIVKSADLTGHPTSRVPAAAAAARPVAAAARVSDRVACMARVRSSRRPRRRGWQCYAKEWSDRDATASSGPMTDAVADAVPCAWRLGFVF